MSVSTGALVHLCTSGQLEDGDAETGEEETPSQGESVRSSAQHAQVVSMEPGAPRRKRGGRSRAKRGEKGMGIIYIPITPQHQQQQQDQGDRETGQPEEPPMPSCNTPCTGESNEACSQQSQGESDRSSVQHGMQDRPTRAPTKLYIPISAPSHSASTRRILELCKPISPEQQQQQQQQQQHSHPSSNSSSSRSSSSSSSTLIQAALSNQQQQRRRQQQQQQQPSTSLFTFTQEAWQGYMRAKGRNTLHQRLHHLLGNLKHSQQRMVVEEALAWLSYEGPI